MRENIKNIMIWRIWLLMVNCSNAIDVNLDIYIYIYIFATRKMINPIHITKLKLLYNVELTKRICGFHKAKHFFYKKNKLEN